MQLDIHGPLGVAICGSCYYQTEDDNKSLRMREKISTLRK